VKLSVEELLAKAEKPKELAMRYHPFYKGKIAVTPKAPVRTVDDFAIWYTPGVAEPCRAIQRDKALVDEYTNKWNTVAVVSDGTRVLGLGDIGPEAGLPVMEGKAMLFKYLGGVDAFPICLDTKEPDEIIQAVRWLQPSFGGINLEDIAKPKCFYILDRLRKEMAIPVWHDDQQGTATIILAGLTNALRLVGKDPAEVTIAMVGAGAANIATLRVLAAAGVSRRNIIMCDSKGILHLNRGDIEAKKEQNPYKWDVCLHTNREGREGGIREALHGTDVVIAASRPGPGTIKPGEVSGMASDSIVFACANPIPEIWPWEAKEAGARIVATGRSDFPNQVNNSLGFPGIFRGTLDVRARTITDEMCISAAHALARFAERRGVSEEYILPTMDQTDAYVAEAVAVGMRAQEQGVARNPLSEDELRERATSAIVSSQRITKLLMDHGEIAQPPK